MNDGTMVCVHELLLVSLALAWLAVQVLLLLGCCVLVKRYVAYNTSYAYKMLLVSIAWIVVQSSHLTNSIKANVSVFAMLGKKEETYLYYVLS